ncbi:MAG: AAA-like domain-containing protein [Planctomycetota bacterium]
MTDGQGNDDGLEKRVSGAGDFTAARYVDLGPRASRCVARVWHDDGPASGVLLPGNWFLTNHHVLPTKETAKAAVIQFNYERLSDGKFAPTKDFHFDPDAGFHTSPVSDGDDWTVVKLKGDANAELGFVALAEATPILNEIVSIIQHPDAGPKQVAQGAIIEVLDAPRRRIRYRVNTLPGSSGSPVFNAHWQVVGLHHSSATTRDKQTGELVECNEGIHIAAVLDGLKSVGVWPHQVAAGDIKLPDGTWDIERKANRDVLKHLRKLRLTVALKGGKQMGKSLIAQRVKEAMRAEGWHVVDVNLGHEFATADYETGHGFLRRLAEKITHQTKADQASLSAFDGDGTPTAFKSFLESLKLSRPVWRLFLVLDRVDAIAGFPCCSPVLSGLRVIHDSQRELDHEAWLQTLLMHTITPRQTGPMASAFDVAMVVEISDFSEGELQRLATLYGLAGVDVPKLHSFLGAHPTLTQLTFSTMLEDDVSLDEIIADFKRTGGIYRPHLDRLVVDFRALPDAKSLANSFRGLAQPNPIPLDSEETFDALLALGVVTGTYSGDAAIRSELYKIWLPPRIPR